jgi:hypothetical protein
MPRWPKEILEGSLFIFPSEEDAKRGSDLGGCGFFVSVPWLSDSRARHVYAVTCEHVLEPRKPLVIRANKIGSSKPDFIPAERDTWKISDGSDLAVKLIGNGMAYRHEPYEAVALTQDKINEFSIGIGDEVIAVGRFIDLEGQTTNRPLIRSGIISAMPEFPVTRKNRSPEDSYIVEMRSRSGFSGSPVYVYLAPPHNRFVLSEKALFYHGTEKPLISDDEFYGPWLLGVHWGEIFVKGPDAPALAQRVDIDEDQKRIELGSGMIGVVPCSRLEALLMKNESVLEERRKAEAEFKPDAMDQAASGPDGKEADKANPSHKEDFTRLLNAAARKRERED